MNNLQFFKGTQSNLNLQPNNDGILTGGIYLPLVSTGLYETVSVFILEEVQVTGSNLKLHKPILNNKYDKLIVKFEDNAYSSPDINLFDATIQDNRPIIQHFERVELQPDTKQVTYTNNYAQVDSVNNQALQFNVGLNSETTGRHERFVYIYGQLAGQNKTEPIARILIYGEVEGEDERLTNLLANLGASLNESDFLLFKEHDIKEQKADQILLNNKRKELLLELGNIQPFIGTYKALRHAIDFFGYNNISLKEYWVNVDSSSEQFGKFYAIDVPDSESSYPNVIDKANQIELPSNQLRKINGFSLVYRINRPANEIDQFGLPQVDEVFEFTPQEVLIKLFGLKNKLEAEFLPGKSYIFDIVGEADYYTQYSLNMWDNQNQIDYISQGQDIKINYYPSNRPLNIEDKHHILRTVLDKPTVGTDYPNDNYKLYTKLINTPNNDWNNLTNGELDLVKDAIYEFYQSYDQINKQTFNQDAPAGAPVILDARDSFAANWLDLQNTTWQDLGDRNLGLTWHNWWHNWVYEIEWHITGPNGFEHTYIGRIEDYVKFPVFLPYTGNYSVQLILHDLFGYQSRYTEDNLIEVKSKEIKFEGFYQLFENVNWTTKLTWGDLTGTWQVPSTSMTEYNQLPELTYFLLNRANYPHDESEGVNFSTSYRYADEFKLSGYSQTGGPYQWFNCQFTWADCQKLIWRGTKISSDIPVSSFELANVQDGDVLEVTILDAKNQQLTTNYTLQSTELADLAVELNNVATSNNLSLFNFRFLREDELILASVKDIVSEQWLTNVRVLRNNESFIDGVNKLSLAEYNNPILANTRFFDSQAQVEKSTHVTISAFNSNIPGMQNPQWEIINDNQIVDTYNNDLILTYIFQGDGEYNIKLTVEDTNGNQQTTTQNLIKTT